MSIHSMAQDILDELASQGIVTSLAFGPMKGFPEAGFSVMCMNKYGEEFARPFAANDMLHAYQIARLECLKRRWLTEAKARQVAMKGKVQS